MKIINIKALIISSVLGLGCLTNAYANTPSNSSIQEYIKLTKIEQNFTSEFTSGFTSAIETQVFTAIGTEYPNITPTQTTKIKAIIQKHLSPIGQDFAKDPKLRKMIMDNISKAIAKHFNQQEIDALNNFFRTPVGQSVADKQSVMYQDFLQSISPQVASMMAAHMDNDKAALIFEKINLEISQVLQ